MYLFHAISTYQLLEMIVYKTHFHKDDKCVLMITDSLVDKFPRYKELSEFFDDIIVYPIVAPPVKGANLAENCKIFFTNVFDSCGFSIQEFDTIYVGCAHYYFGIYLASYNIPFVFFEDASGIASRPDILVNIEKEKYPVKQKYNLELGLYDGSAEAVQRIVCNHTSQNDDIKSRTEHFDVVETFISFPEDIQSSIKSFFISFDKIDIPLNSALFLTQHLASLKLLNYEEHILLYQMVIDYFFKNETVVFKPHPDDIVPYGLLFPNFNIIREKFPSEFLPVMFTNKPKTIATVSSTAIFNLQNSFDNSFCLYTRTEKDFFALHRYFAATRLYRILNLDSQIIGIGDNKPVVEEFIKKENISQNSQENKYYIIDDIETEDYPRDDIISLIDSMGEKDVAIFINYKEDYCLYNVNRKDIFNYIIPICIKKKRLKEENFYADTKSETMYVYTKNKEFKHMIEQANINETLEYTGLEISFEQMTEEERKFKVLEGILKATEKRLLFYMDRVEKLEKEVEKK